MQYTSGSEKSDIMPLGMKGWYSLHSVVNENKFWESIGALKAAGCGRDSGGADRENGRVILDIGF